MLTQDEHKLYIDIKQAEVDEEYNTMQKGLDKFSRMNANAFMILLDWVPTMCNALTRVVPKPLGFAPLTTQSIEVPNPIQTISRD